MAALPSSLSIREVAERSGCSPSALRYYEAEGLIASLPRPETASRRYAPSVLDALYVITALRGAGFGITDIRTLLATRQPGDPGAMRLQKAQAALTELSAILRQRRAALEQAEELLNRWQAEVEAAQQEPSPVTCSDPTR